jgi:hypothetical protein
MTSSSEIIELVKRKRGQRGLGKKPAKVPMGFLLDPVKRDKLENFAEKHGMTLTQVIELAIDNYLNI